MEVSASVEVSTASVAVSVAVSIIAADAVSTTVSATGSVALFCAPPVNTPVLIKNAKIDLLIIITSFD